MSKTERNKFLQLLMGGCWHEKICTSCGCMGATYACKHCGERHYEHTPLRNPGFTTPLEFFRLVEWSRSQIWWSDFWLDLQQQSLADYEVVGDNPLFFLPFLDPDKLADALYAYLNRR